jgi:hypothetical protein
MRAGRRRNFPTRQVDSCQRAPSAEAACRRRGAASAGRHLSGLAASRIKFGKARRPRCHAPFPVWPLSLSGKSRACGPAVWVLTCRMCGSPHALSRLFARAGARGARWSAGRPGGTWLRELRPPKTPLPSAAIGRLLSRMPVIIRSHESSGTSMRENSGQWIKTVAQFAYDIDSERYYF